VRLSFIHSVSQSISQSVTLSSFNESTISSAVCQSISSRYLGRPSRMSYIVWLAYSNSYSIKLGRPPTQHWVLSGHQGSNLLISLHVSHSVSLSVHRSAVKSVRLVRPPVGTPVRLPISQSLSQSYRLTHCQAVIPGIFLVCEHSSMYCSISYHAASSSTGHVLSLKVIKVGCK